MSGIAVWAAASLASGGAIAAPAGDAVATRPNVVLIIADDMALGDVGAFNGGRSHTPNIDRLIAGGVWFNRGYSASSVCAPARAALHTGRYPHRTGVVSLSMATEPELTRLKRDETTIADAFKAAGYQTGLVGKWHVGLGSDWHPLRRGFQEFTGFIGAPGSFYNYELEVAGQMRQFTADYLTPVLSAGAVDFVRRHRERPFFLELAHAAPHRPLEAPPEVVQKYRDRGETPNTAKIYAMVEVMDRGIGELLQTLEELRLRERTLVVFVSDNGPDPLTGERFNLGLRGTKYTINEGGIRVPVVMNWPGRLKPGETDVVFNFVDLPATVAELAGIQWAPRLPSDGRSLAGELLRGVAGPAAERPLYWQWNRGDPNYTHNAALLHGAWKLVRPFVTHKQASPQDSAERPVLYHLATDPAETTDLSHQHPDRYATMLTALEAWCRAVETDRRRLDLPAATTPVR
jgi:arylsulfatase A